MVPWVCVQFVVVVYPDHTHYFFIFKEGNTLQLNGFLWSKYILFTYVLYIMDILLGYVLLLIQGSRVDPSFVRHFLGD